MTATQTRPSARRIGSSPWGVSLHPLTDLPALDHLKPGFRSDATRAGDVPAGPGLASLVCTKNSQDTTLDGLERRPCFVPWLTACAGVPSTALPRRPRR
ncbi:hypothetical protein [Streptomyces sp. NBC_00078]|uniref:hypothetical protein n=1 Tax=unclassified Streptomyces TaxID=2593676 RepID=UPI0022558822|nr:hypothetical protein [Streptomyces sp. NBC_00078]MCX5424594.1 hypothetical protein [Streptomyces sp. NBC_00078]